MFHFSSLKPFTDAHFNELANEPPTTVPTDAEEVFEVESLIDYKRTHTPPTVLTSGTPRKGPHDLVRWKGYSSQHDLWLPVGELSYYLDKVAEYFSSASPKQRTVPIDQFPRAERDQLAHLLQRAHGSSTAKGRSEPVMSRHPRLTTRTRRHPSRLAKAVQTAAITSHAICSSCARHL